MPALNWVKESSFNSRPYLTAYPCVNSLSAACLPDLGTPVPDSSIAHTGTYFFALYFSAK